MKGVKVIGYNSPLYYANGALFTKQVYAITGVMPEKRRKQLKKLAKVQTEVGVRNVSRKNPI